MDDLLVIPFMDFKNAQLIVYNRIKYGEYFSLIELFSIEGIDDDVIEKTKLFLTVKFL